MKTLLLLSGLTFNVLLRVYPLENRSQKAVPSPKQVKLCKAKPVIKPERKSIPHAELLRKKAEAIPKH